MNNWGVAGWVLVCVLAAIVFGEATTTRSVFHREKYHQEGNRGADRYCETKVLMSVRDPASPGDPDSTERSEKDKDDLCQQWRMAEAAEDAAIAAWVQLPMNVLGLFLVGLATIIAARSAGYAADAAKAAQRAVDAERAVLYVEQPSAPLETDGVISIRITNVGRTIAVPIAAAGDTIIDLPRSPAYLKAEPILGGLIRPELSHQVPVRWTLGQRYVVGYLDYTNGFGEMRRHGFAFEIVHPYLVVRRAGGATYNYDKTVAGDRREGA